MSSVQRPQGLVLEALERRVGSNLVLDGLNLSVAPGECLALLGPSGCGKTTTLRLIAGLDQPSAGRIRLDGDDITRQPPSRREVGMVFQSYALYPHLTVERNLSLGMELRGLPRGRIAEQISSVLELLQLEPQRRRRPAELSGGQRQRVALARALVRKPRLFLLDEPASGLDPKARIQLRDILKRLSGEGRTIPNLTFCCLDRCIRHPHRDNHLGLAGEQKEIAIACEHDRSKDFFDSMNERIGK